MYIEARTKSFLFLLAIWFILGVASCNSRTNSPNENDQFVSMFPDLKFTGYLRLHAVKNGPISPETNEDFINIAVINTSNQQIIIHLDSPHRNYVYDKAKGDWILIPEKTNYGTRTTITLYPETDLEKEQFNDWVDLVKPDLSKYKKPIVVRSLFLGEIAQNGESTGQKVGSYIDITFKP